MDIDTFNNDLLHFLTASKTPFHAVQEMASRLEATGFSRLSESDNWQLKEGGRYFVVRNGSSLVAFVQGASPLTESGWRMVGAHTDSPCLKVKPNAEIRKKGYLQLGVEVYGGVLLNPWFDRDLSLAGRVTFRNGEGLQHAYIDFQRPIAVVPSLAIHLDREANKNRSVNPQTDIPPLLMQLDKEQQQAAEGSVLENLLLTQLQQQYPDQPVEKILDYELSFYDTQMAALVGVNQEFIASARLDNLLSCYIGMQALLAADGSQHCVLVCNDHEEVGSQSAIGAQGPFLKAVLRRLVDDANHLTRVLDQSMLISADNAHGVHPNYADRHDGNHGPILNQGPVIKNNANQRYATNSETAALFKHCCELAEQPHQSFVVRTDMGCGSTIGPITASELGVKTLDVGLPTFAMHSIRELAGTSDAWSMYQVLKVFNREASICVY